MRHSAMTVICRSILLLGIASLIFGHAAFTHSAQFFTARQVQAPRHAAPMSAPDAGTPSIDGYAPCDAAAFSGDPLYGLDEESGFATGADATANTVDRKTSDQANLPSMSPPANVLPTPTLPCSQPLTAPALP